MVFAIIKRWFTSQTTNWFLQQLRDIPTSGTTRSSMKKKIIFHNDLCDGDEVFTVQRANDVERKMWRRRKATRPAVCDLRLYFSFMYSIDNWHYDQNANYTEYFSCQCIRRLRALDSLWRFAIATRKHSTTGEMSFILYYLKWDSHIMSHTVLTVVSFAGNGRHCANEHAHFHGKS